MFKFIAIVFMTLLNQTAMAQSSSNDFGRSDSKNEVLTAEDIRERFELVGKIFVTNESGKLLYSGNEVRIWKFGKSGDLVSHWHFQSQGIKDIAIKHTWSLQGDGKITAHIQQFESMRRKDKGREVETGKLIREEKIELKDFAPISWVAQVDTQFRVIVRFTPEIGEKTEYISAESLPISLANPVVFDTKGRLWAQGRDLEGRFVSIKTHFGQIAMSYEPFKGAKEIGYAKNSEIILNADNDLRLVIRSEGSVITSSRPIKVFGIINEDKKTERYNSINTSSSSSEKNFLKNLE